MTRAPRNRRPRDAAGRPLPYGSIGVPRVPDDLRLSPAESLREAQRLLDAVQPFAAHEVLEAAWKAAPTAERLLWRSLAQLAVGLTHLQRGNRTGAAALLSRGGAGLADYAGRAPHGVAVEQLSRWSAEAAATIERGAAEAPAPPRLLN